MRPIELRVPWLPFGNLAMVIWPLVLLTPTAYADECIRLHEAYHWHQALRWGVLPWYVAYAILGISVLIRQRPQNEHPFERRAYELEWECAAKRTPTRLD